MRMCWNSTCSWIVAWCMYRRHFSAISVVAVHCPGSSPPTPFSPSFHCFNSVTGVSFSYCMGTHDWVAMLCQPWEQSLSRSWLPIVEAYGCLRHLTYILVMQLLMGVNCLLIAISNFIHKISCALL